MTERTIEIRTYDRGEFMGLFSFLARAIDTRFLHNPEEVFVIALQGGAGKSLIADTMIHTWRDDVSLHAARTLPADKKMYLEKYLSEATERVLSEYRKVAGQTMKLAFSSRATKYSDELDYDVRATFQQKGREQCGVYFGSHLKEDALTSPNTKVPLIINLWGTRVTSHGAFEHYISISVLSDELFNDFRFKPYWNNLENRERWAGKPAQSVLAMAS